ncbi:hypothetical protein MMC14_004422, partial [Varicellaria rhodocarpa]|nr:hypothetical protein [Varicellaria rhodocarpa]
VSSGPLSLDSSPLKDVIDQMDNANQQYRIYGSIEAVLRLASLLPQQCFHIPQIHQSVKLISPTVIAFNTTILTQRTIQQRPTLGFHGNPKDCGVQDSEDGNISLEEDGRYNAVRHSHDTTEITDSWRASQNRGVLNTETERGRQQ